MPSVAHKPFTKVSDSYKTIISDFLDKSQVESFPNQTRWNPLPLPDDSMQFCCISRFRGDKLIPKRRQIKILFDWYSTLEAGYTINLDHINCVEVPGWVYVVSSHTYNIHDFKLYNPICMACKKSCC